MIHTGNPPSGSSHTSQLSMPHIEPSIIIASVWLFQIHPISHGYTLHFSRQKHPTIMDILDGYHRYISMSEIVREDPTFDYPMMIQIVSFSEEKARQFIFQEDQKTQMKKVDSAAMNQYNPANTAVAKLNTDPNSNLRGEIVKTTGKIDPSFLAALKPNPMVGGNLLL